MSPKTREISIYLGDRIVLPHKQGKSDGEIDKTLNINYSTVRYVIKRHEETGNTANKPGSGRPKALTNWER